MTGHSASNCRVGIQPSSAVQMEQADALTNFNQRQNFNPYSNSYNPGWRSHPNLSYQSNQNQSGQSNFSTPTEPQKSNMETMLEKFLTVQTQQNEDFRQHIIASNQQHKDTTEALQLLTGKVDSLANHNKMLEFQIAQVASSSTGTSGKFPGNTEENPIEHCNAITLRSGRIVHEDSKEPEDMHRTQYSPTGVNNTGVSDEESQEDEPMPNASDQHTQTRPDTTGVPDTDLPKPADQKEKEVSSNLETPVRTYTSPVPFPQRLAKAKLDEQFGKFLDMLRTFYINIPFTEVLQQMPTYSKFLKDILTNKRRLDDNATVALTEKCSAVIKNKLSPKLNDPGSFSIPCTIGEFNFENAFCDLGASVNLIPLSICKKLDLGAVKLTTMALQLADRSIRYPLGILEDVPVKVGNFVIPADFVVLEMDEDPCIPLILGRPFLATAGAMIDVKNHRLSLTFENEKIEFVLPKDNKPPSNFNVYCRMDGFESKGPAKVDEKSNLNKIEVWKIKEDPGQRGIDLPSKLYSVGNSRSSLKENEKIENFNKRE